jgi:peptidylprolyl isomerase
VTERVSSGPRDGESGGSGRSNAVKVHPDQPAAGEARAGAAKPAAKSTAAKSTAARPTAAKSTGAAGSAPKSAGPRSAAPRSAAKGAEPQALTKAEKRTLAKQRKARAIAARKRKRALTGALIGLLVVVVIAGGVWLISRSGGSPSAEASASASASAPAADATTPAFPPTPAGADPALATKPTVTAGTGDVTKLNVTTLIQGTGAQVKSGQSITVNYVGVTYKDGKEFDSSWKNSQAFTTVIGNGSVIKGWDQGLVGVKVGSRVQLDIPSDLAYGDSGNPAGALRFVVDVLSATG